MMETDSFYCRVCSLYLGYQPWGEDGRTPSYNSLCCGVEFGYEDDSIPGIKLLRLNSYHYCPLKMDKVKN